MKATSRLLTNQIRSILFDEKPIRYIIVEQISFWHFQCFDSLKVVLQVRDGR